MAIQNLSEDVALVTLPVEPQIIIRELKLVNEIVSNKGGCDVVIDFSNVEMLPSSGISNLMILRGLLREQGRQLTLCSVSPTVKDIFTIAGIDEVFEFVDDKHAALASIQHTN